ncbi:hypothetical protein [Pseudomonas sp. Marseille-Q1929]|uniref:hypothetical protein n=1 Tax=Pseudomonas sp. Marseille-Q1929 TaxID=2730402 RepID=UPI001A8CA604|nr:hypothetical protein [Pseudomonas sp. Marseille-Q1929]MBO0494372.1 hypothetical protein [Pseudomonas sp. Marseille-Q1929]
MDALGVESIGKLSTFLIVLIASLLVCAVVCGVCRVRKHPDPSDQVIFYSAITESFVIVMAAALVWDSANFPAWLQGIGSIYAIVAAILVSRHESRRSEERSRQERAEDHRREAQKVAEEHRREARRVAEEKIETTRAIYQIVLRAFLCFSFVRENAYDSSLTSQDIGPQTGAPESKVKAGKAWISWRFKAADIRVQIRQLEAFVEQLVRISPFEHKDAVLALHTSEFCASIAVFLADLRTGWNVTSKLPDLEAEPEVDPVVKYPPGEKNATYTETEKLIGLSEYLALGMFHHYLDQPECKRIEKAFLSWEARAEAIFSNSSAQQPSGKVNS